MTSPIWNLREGRRFLSQESRVYDVLSAELNRLRVCSERVGIYEEVGHMYGCADLAIVHGLTEDVDPKRQVLAVEVKPSLVGVGANIRSGVAQATAHKIGLALRFGITSSFPGELHAVVLSNGWDDSAKNFADLSGVILLNPIELANCLAEHTSVSKYASTSCLAIAAVQNQVMLSEERA